MRYSTSYLETSLKMQKHLFFRICKFLTYLLSQLQSFRTLPRRTVPENNHFFHTNRCHLYLSLYLCQCLRRRTYYTTENLLLLFLKMLHIRSLLLSLLHKSQSMAMGSWLLLLALCIFKKGGHKCTLL
jgi:hypothetical protein